MHAVMFYFLFSKFYKQTYVNRNDKQKQTNGKVPREKKPVNICFPGQNDLYDVSKSANGYAESYTSKQNLKLRHKTFVDKRDTA